MEESLKNTAELRNEFEQKKKELSNLRSKLNPLGRDKESAFRELRSLRDKVKFRADRRAIIVSFEGLNEVASVSYSLTYRTRGTDQGAGGIIDSKSGGTATRELVFGTASNGIFRYDTDISNARLTITTTLKNGLKVVKPFKLKV